MSTRTVATGETEGLAKRGWQMLHTLLSIELLLLTATLLVSIYSQSINIQRQHEMKTIDLMTHFQNRYDTLMWEVSPTVDEEVEAQAYFSRYWNMQLEQYEYWQQGLIADDVYAYWTSLRRATYNDAAYRPFRTFPDYTFQQGWEFARADLHVDVDTYGFGSFMQEVMTGDREITAIMAEYKRPRPSWLREFVQDLPWSQ
jgi:hypothetical protein